MKNNSASIFARALWLSVICYWLFTPGALRAGVTNITVKLTTEIAGLANGTNNVSLKFQQDGSAKDALTVDSLVWYWTAANVAGTYTNDFTSWLKDTSKVALQSHIAEKSTSDIGAAIDKVAAAKSDTSILTAGQKAALIAIAATLP